MGSELSLVDWVAAYLEWIDDEPAAPSRETMLLSALRAESDCLHVLRQVLDAGESSAGSVQLAIDGLAEAQRLLEAEQRAWDALIEARESAWETRGPAWPADFDRAWPVTLSVVSAEMRALADRVLALRPH